MLIEFLKSHEWQKAISRCNERKSGTNLEVSTEDKGDGRLPLHIACFEKAPIEVLKALIEICPEAVKTAWPEPSGQNDLPLHLLCKSDKWGNVEGKMINAQSVEYLIDLYPAALLKRTSDELNTPLHQICEEFPNNVADDMLKIIKKILLTKPKASEIKGGVNEKFQPAGLLPLHSAVINTDIRCVKKLYKLYKNGIKLTCAEGSLPIHWCTQVGCSVEMMKFLLKKYPDGIFCRNTAGDTPLHNLLIVDYCEKKYDPNGKSMNPLHSSIHILLGAFLRFAKTRPDYMRLLTMRNNDGNNVSEIARSCERKMGENFNILSALNDFTESNFTRLKETPFIKEEEDENDVPLVSEGWKHNGTSTGHESATCSTGSHLHHSTSDKSTIGAYHQSANGVNEEKLSSTENLTGTNITSKAVENSLQKKKADLALTRRSKSTNSTVPKEKKSKLDHKRKCLKETPFIKEEEDENDVPLVSEGWKYNGISTGHESATCSTGSHLHHSTSDKSTIGAYHQSANGVNEEKLSSTENLTGTNITSKAVENSLQKKKADLALTRRSKSRNSAVPKKKKSKLDHKRKPGDSAVVGDGNDCNQPYDVANRNLKEISAAHYSSQNNNLSTKESMPQLISDKELNDHLHQNEFRHNKTRNIPEGDVMTDREGSEKFKPAKKKTRKPAGMSTLTKKYRAYVKKKPVQTEKSDKVSNGISTEHASTSRDNLTLSRKLGEQLIYKDSFNVMNKNDSKSIESRLLSKMSSSGSAVAPETRECMSKQKHSSTNFIKSTKRCITISKSKNSQLDESYGEVEDLATDSVRKTRENVAAEKSKQAVLNDDIVGVQALPSGWILDKMADKNNHEEISFDNDEEE
eukprot:CAMPEP_0194444566 /NCGR_PEP_ID=MMETSP0176-20130528/127349_1 /TAXON_ID=216777 /ORGANISM="Proboscia alata, Strain PI-D3" /LENGTH=859 /DNA_ID=CAMNT_0039270973 /DNA_START=125 /DNA_END=2701 /DNA_ORIENTATION=-